MPVAPTTQSYFAPRGKPVLVSDYIRARFKAATDVSSLLERVEVLPDRTIVAHTADGKWYRLRQEALSPTMSLGAGAVLDKGKQASPGRTALSIIWRVVNSLGWGAVALAGKRKDWIGRAAWWVLLNYAPADWRESVTTGADWAHHPGHTQYVLKPSDPGYPMTAGMLAGLGITDEEAHATWRTFTTSHDAGHSHTVDLPLGAARPSHPDQLRGKPGERQGTVWTKDKVQLLMRLAREGAHDPEVRKVAESIVAGLPNKNYKRELEAVYNWVVKNIRYTLDPVDREVVRTAPRLLKDRQGDCDDHTVLTAALLRTLGHPVRIALWGKSPGNWQHIFPVAFAKDVGRWFSIDTTEPVVRGNGRGFGWRPKGGATKLFRFGDDRAGGHQWGGLGAYPIGMGPQFGGFWSRLKKKANKIAKKAVAAVKTVAPVVIGAAAMAAGVPPAQAAAIAKVADAAMNPGGKPNKLLQTATTLTLKGPAGVVEQLAKTNPAVKAVLDAIGPMPDSWYSTAALRQRRIQDLNAYFAKRPDARLALIARFQTTDPDVRADPAAAATDPKRLWITAWLQQNYPDALDRPATTEQFGQRAIRQAQLAVPTAAVGVLRDTIGLPVEALRDLDPHLALEVPRELRAQAMRDLYESQGLPVPAQYARRDPDVVFRQRFDPSSGRQLTPRPEIVVQFDRRTGEPLEIRKKFNPYTGQRLNAPTTPRPEFAA